MCSRPLPGLGWAQREQVAPRANQPVTAQLCVRLGTWVWPAASDLELSRARLALGKGIREEGTAKGTRGPEDGSELTAEMESIPGSCHCPPGPTALLSPSPGLLLPLSSRSQFFPAIFLISNQMPHPQKGLLNHKTAPTLSHPPSPLVGCLQR